MDLTSPLFFGFLVLVLVAFYTLPSRFQIYILLAASYIFYLTWSWQFSLILFMLTLVNFFLAQLIGLVSNNRRLFLWLGVGLNLMALALFKYASFFLPQLQNLLVRLNIFTDPLTIQILLPVGLSYYVLHAISYLVDVYHGQLIATKKLPAFALYMAYFPKLLSGPIERAGNFLEKITGRRVVDKQVISRSGMLIGLGLFRKLVIANPLTSLIPATFFTAPGKFTSTQLVVWLFAFSFALYNDFAGYTNIARGISGLFGIELPVNFRFPYFMNSISDFWTRWHVSLSMWMRDYIYFPLSRWFLRRNSEPSFILGMVVPPMITMIASGLWHGVSLRMLIWGAAMGAYIAIERALSGTTWWAKISKVRWFGRALVFLILFFIATIPSLLFVMDIPTLIAFVRTLFLGPLGSKLDPRILFIVLLSVLIDYVQFRARDEYTFIRWPVLSQAVLLAVAILAIFLVTRADPGGPFVYQGF